MHESAGRLRRRGSVGVAGENAEAEAGAHAVDVGGAVGVGVGSPVSISIATVPATNKVEVIVWCSFGKGSWCLQARCECQGGVL